MAPVTGEKLVAMLVLATVGGLLLLIGRLFFQEKDLVRGVGRAVEVSGYFALGTGTFFLLIGLAITGLFWAASNL